MSKGKWKHKIPPAERERSSGIYGLHTIRIEPWIDRRVKAREKSRIQTAELLASVLARVASANRKSAREISAARYVGSKCSKHPGAGGMRYSFDGNCVRCSAENSRARRKAKQTSYAAHVPPGPRLPGPGHGMFPPKPHRRSPRAGRATGTWSSTEQPDAMKAEYRLCAVCSRPVPDTRDRSSTCSAVCARKARAARKAVINHTEACSGGP